MPSRYIGSVPQHIDSTGAPYSGAKLFFYQEGTSTKLDTYPTLADAIAGTNANANPITLNSKGEPSVSIFLQDRRYKVVLAPSTDTDPPTNPISTWDVVGDNFTIFTIRKTGSGTPNGTVAGTAGSSGVLATEYWDYTNSILYVCTTTGTSSTAVWTAINASSATPVVPRPQGYLTLVSATPVITSDQSAKTIIYYTPDGGDLIPIYNGATFSVNTFTELSLTLDSSGHATNTLYDVFVWSESGVLTIGTGPAWATSTAGSGSRGSGASTTQITKIKGLYVNAVSMTARNNSVTYAVGANRGTYVGTILIDGTAGQVTCHTSFGQNRKRGVWNAYNRKPVVLTAGDATASWSYVTSTIRASNNTSANKISVMTGLAEEYIDIHFTQKFGIPTSQNNPNNLTSYIGIGVNSTTTTSGMLGSIEFGASAMAAGENTLASGTASARHMLVPSLGLNDISCLEFGGGSTNTFYGSSSRMLLTAQYMA